MNHFTERQLEEGDRQYTEAKDRAWEASQAASRAKTIERVSNTIQAVHLLGGKYSPTRIELPCGRSLHYADAGVWELDFNFEVAISGDEKPVVLAAKIRKLLVRHDDFLLTKVKTSAK